MYLGIITTALGNIIIASNKIKRNFFPGKLNLAKPYATNVADKTVNSVEIINSHKQERYGE